MNKEVSAYMKKQKSPQKEILQKVRKIFFKTIPKCEEKKEWGVITFSNGKFYIVGLKDKVNVGFSINGLTKEEIGLFEGSGKTMRHIKIRSLDEIDEKRAEEAKMRAEGRIKKHVSDLEYIRSKAAYVRAIERIKLVKKYSKPI